MFESSTSLSKNFVYVLFALIIIGLQLSGTLVILQGTMGYTGQDNSKITMTTCNLELYRTYKFSALLQMIKVSFYMSIISTACFATMLIIVFIWVRRICSIQQFQKVSNLIERKTKILIFLLGSVSITSIIPILGYYLTFIIELSQCDAYYYDAQQIRTIFVIASIFLVFALTVTSISLYVVNKDINQQKYKEVVGTYQTYNTQPAENIPQYKPHQPIYENYQRRTTQIYKKQRVSLPQQPPPPKIIYSNQPNKQLTQQNLFQPSPSKKAFSFNYNKQSNAEHVAEDNKFKSPIQKYLYEKNPQPRSYINIPSNSKISQKPKNSSPQKMGELIYHNKNSSFVQREDHDIFKNQQQRYLSKFGAPILPSSGVSQVENRKKDSDYFNSPNKRNIQNSPQDRGKEGVLLKYIRNKYAY